MLTKESLKNATPTREPVEVEVDGWSDTILLRYPTWKEWHNILKSHKQAGEEGPPAEVIVRTIGVVLSNPDGSRMLNDNEALDLMKSDFDSILALYNKAWATVLGSGQKLEEAEKN